MLTLNARIKDLFFDRQAVIDQIGKDRARFLRNIGRYIQRVARSSMKRKGKARKPPKNQTGKAYQRWLDEIQKQPASPPGTPPFVHTDDKYATLKNILFAFNTVDSVVVGPVGLRATSNVPSLHEYGGSQTIHEKKVAFPNGGHRWIPTGRRGARRGQPLRARRVTYPARPYMAPAITKTQSTGKFSDLWHTRRAG